jgi:hypothetical protein
VLQRFERRLEGLVEGTFAKVFGGVVQPSEVAVALQRETGDKKMEVGPGRTLVPNTFVVELGQSDAERLLAYEKPLRREFAAMVSEHAAEQGWSFVGPVDVQLQQSTDLDTGVFRIRSEVLAGPEPEQPPAPGLPPSPWAPAPPELEVPAPTVAPRPYLVVTDRLTEGRTSERREQLTRTVTTIGRGADADLRLNDTGVSRTHAEIHVEPEGAGWRTTLRDLRSTNGTRVNGERVESCVLHDGDRLSLGSTALVLRQES